MIASLDGASFLVLVGGTFLGLGIAGIVSLIFKK